MESGIGCVRRKFLYLTVLLLPASVSFAGTDNFTPYVYTSVTYDSNLFRVANDAEAISILGSTNKDDTVRHLGAGFQFELPVSRQLLRADATVDRANYDTYDILNNTETDGQATWAWQVGNLWSGNLGYSYSKQLSTFYELQSVLKETRTENAYFLDGGYQFHPDWRLIGSISQSGQDYQERKELELESRSRRLEIQYQNTLNTRMGLRANVTEIDLLNLEDVGGTLVNNDSTQTEISGVFYWEGTSKSHFEARVGITNQKYDELSERDFHGSIGRMTYLWFMTEKTKLDISLWRETDSGYYDVYDETTAFVVTKGMRISPVWSATPKITVSGTFSYEQDGFEGENAVILGSGLKSREDKIRLFRVNAGYNPAPNVDFSLAYQLEKRTSNRKDSEFDSSQIDAKVQLSF